MATRVRTAAVWVPPLQEGDSSCRWIRKLHDQESIVGQGTPAQRPPPRGLQQRNKSRRRKQVLEWLFSSQEQPKTTTSQTKSGKWRITWNGLRKIKASWEILQNTVNVLHLGNCVFLLQILFPRGKSFINVAHMERV
ncbi:PREDICTED: zinc finger protein 268 isoform X9 [Hipposideros armiger]|uniref:Zinc finger protein 268 isoform X9 n=1 Tax=Hipposideros armiger TaxID=186990 RepID=A0A8B7QFZ3_HIPAR|nr:PREDICTED: zinc finger protein 268 isoform X9 [Hipposideros armiger]